MPPLESGFPWERSPLAGIPSTKILAELQRRRERSAQLLAERATILERMEAIEQRLELIGHDVEALAHAASDVAQPAGRRGRKPSPEARTRATSGGTQAGRRAKTGKARAGARHASRDVNAVSLREAIALAVEPRALVTPAEAAELVKKNGYVSRAANFGMLVANALAKDERFRRLGRGSYERIG